MLRAVRFRWQLGFAPATDLYEAIAGEAHRLSIISAERIRDELFKMLERPTAADALSDLLRLNLIHEFAPEFEAMVGIGQGGYHHLDVWHHTLLVVRNAGAGDLVLTLAALLHDVGKPATISIDEKGNARYFSHEVIGSEMARAILRRLRVPGEATESVVTLVRNHMRLGSSPQFTPSAARRVLRDLDGLVPQLLQLVDADTRSLKPGVKVLDLGAIRRQLDAVARETPASKLVSPLSGAEIMEITGLTEGPEIGRIKEALAEHVLEGELQPGDKAGAEAWVRSRGSQLGS
jgi:poly(A) polymerase